MKVNLKYQLCHSRQGSILALSLIFLAVGALLLPPLLSYMGTALKHTVVYRQKTNELYAADSGLTDAKWKIKYGELGGYSPYDFNHSFSYSLDGEVGSTLNGSPVNVDIANVWIPKNIPTPVASQAGDIVQADKLVVTSSVSGTTTYQIKVTYYQGANDAPLEIKTLGVWLPPGFSYVAGSSNLELSHADPYYPAGVSVDPWDSGQAVTWTFNPGTLFAGSVGPPAVKPFPGVDTSKIPLTSTITFSFSSQQAGAIPSAVSWVTTDKVSDIPFSWDADTKVYHVTAEASGTTVETYLVQNDLRQLGGALAGDYYATGNSNLSDQNGDKYRETWHDPSSASVTSNNIPADADVAAAYLYWTGWKNNDSKADVAPLNPDTADNLNNWNADAAWDSTTNPGSFSGSTYNRAGKYLTLKNSLNLSQYAPGLVVVSWDQSTAGALGAGDGLDFAISQNGGSTWSSVPVFRGPGSPASSFSYNVPAQYLASGNFKIRFTVVGFSGSGKYCYLDNIRITTMLPDSSVVFKIDDGTGAKQVYLDGSNQPQQGMQELSASRTQVVQNFGNGTIPHGFSYSSFRDVTALVRAYSQAPTAPNTNWPGYAIYSVGGISADASPIDEWAYACWSLVIIYTSPQTQGHQLFLYDKFTYSNQNSQNGVNVDFDGDGQPGGTISGFIVPQRVPGEVNAGKITTFAGEGDVWYSGDYVALNGTKLWDGTSTNDNSKSNPDNAFNSTSMGLSAYDGIDVDTLGIDPPNGQYITWDSGLLHRGDTSARIDMVTHNDVWNLVYIIISFRSATTTGGNLNYLVH
jgi:hypothetical protein